MTPKTENALRRRIEYLETELKQWKDYADAIRQSLNAANILIHDITMAIPSNSIPAKPWVDIQLAHERFSRSHAEAIERRPR